MGTTRMTGFYDTHCGQPTCPIGGRVDQPTSHSPSPLASLALIGFHQGRLADPTCA